MKRDAIQKRNDGNGRPAVCGFGCRTFRPIQCKALDPFTVRMTAACVRCGRQQTSVGDLRRLVDDARSAEDFAASFMRQPTIGGLRS